MNSNTTKHGTAGKAPKSPAIQPTSPQSPAMDTPKASDKATDNTQKRRSTNISIALLVTASIIAMGYYFLVVQNSDTLFMAQNKSFFTTDDTFLRECMKRPGGFINWAASFFNQFFYYPALGSTIMVAFWAASLWLSKLAYRVSGSWMAVLSLPLVCILVSMIDTGYWLFYLKHTGYWFCATLGYFFATLMVCLQSYTRKWVDSVILTAITALSYPFMGWYSLLALLYTAAMLTFRPHKKYGKKTRISIISLPIAAAIAIPLVFQPYYPELRPEQIWTSGLTFFQSDALDSFYPQLPLIMLAIIPLTFSFLPRTKQAKANKPAITIPLTIAILAASFFWAKESDFQNYNYHAEMRMYCAAEAQDWDKVLEEMSALPGDASREMVLLKNVALLNKGEMGTKMYRYNNNGDNPKNGFDTLHVHMVQVGAPLIYYYHGKTNFASRWCIENSVEFGPSFDNIKLQARCALINGEMDLARKYLDILATSTFYKDWANKLLPITSNPELIKEYPEFDNVCELWSHMGTTLDGDNGLCEMYLLNYFSNTMNKDSKLLQELTLNYAMVQKDIQLFWPRFFQYAHLHAGENMPTHYQEAAYLYGHLEPQNVNINGMPFDKNVVDRYEGFQRLSQSLLAQGMDAKTVGENMKSTYGDTFYWFYFFCRDIHSY